VLLRQRCEIAGHFERRVHRRRGRTGAPVGQRLEPIRAAEITRLAERTVERGNRFARHLDLNSNWMPPFIEAHKTYCGNDYKTFQRVLSEMPSFKEAMKEGWAAVPAVYTFWKSESRLRIAATMSKGFVGWRIVPEYERLLSFFTSSVMGHAEPAQLTQMADQYSLWRTARAIATALYLLSWQIMLLLTGTIFKAILSLFNFDLLFFGRLTLHLQAFVTITINYLLLLSLAAISAGITTFIVRGTYSRLCFTLFTLLYLVCGKQTVSDTHMQPKP